LITAAVLSLALIASPSRGFASFIYQKIKKKSGNFFDNVLDQVTENDFVNDY